ncbi:hypothetical protein LIER_08859 [Lithospermum erythrorhizon]|uniref:Uncharacterized protein n=1 Tax=Lithospermum erythrorhizon TaxID=34254 RepID=A0AAV3PDM5_LITER
MVSKSSNKPKKRFITEENTAILLQRYSATTVLALLQEVAQVQGVKIDWNKMVRKTETGITNAREYQMLWRHLAYQESLLKGVDHGAQLLDDDSDLECELEAFPAISAEASAEASACVKVLIASGLSSDAHGTNGTIVKAPLTINIPQSHAFGTPSANHQCSGSMRGKNITIPITVKKQPLPSVTSSENLDIIAPATGNGANKRKRRWSEQEDKEFVEAVHKHGEGNWANLLKGPYKTDRTAAQLSQRWSFLKKKQGNINSGPGSQLSEEQLATRHAMLCALDMPMGDNLKSVSTVKAAGTSLHVASGSAVHPAVSGSLKSLVASKQPLAKMSLSPESMVKATAVAAGARIATPSDVASHLKAAQSKNAVHIKSGGGSIMNSSMHGSNFRFRI